MENDAACSDPLDADALMGFAERIEALPAADAEWVGQLFAECLRARLSEAELLCAQGEAAPAATPSHTDFAQLALDCADWLHTLWKVGYMGAGRFPAEPRTAFPLIDLDDVTKSALFARIRAGKKPLPFPPPTRDGLPWHELIEDRDAEHEVAAEVVRDEDGRPVGAIVAGGAGWGVVEELGGDAYRIAHRGRGPVFRLQLAGGVGRLRREPPAVTRTIRLQERGGFSSYCLEWPGAEGGVQAIALRAATWERAEAEAAHWIATNHAELYGQVRFDHATG